MNESNIAAQAISALRGAGVVPAIAASLSDETDATVMAIRAAIVTDVPAYTASHNPEVLPELEAHLRDHAAEICRLLRGEREQNVDFIRAHAQRRAEQKFPLDALLQGYRGLHRLLLPWVRDTALAAANQTAHVRRVVAAVTSFLDEYMSAAAALLTREYVNQTRQLAEAEGDRRTELFSLLLGGFDESDSRAAQILRRAGYLEQRQSFCVAVARSVEASEMANPARAQRMVDALTETMSSAPVRVLAGVRDNLVVVILSSTRRLSGWTAPQSLLAERLYPHLRRVGPAALIGLSADAPSTSHIPRALEEARLALDFASVSERVMTYSHISFRHLLVGVARENIQSALPAWLPAFRNANDKSGGRLLETLRAYADADMNVLKAAKQLTIHPNTIYARMQRIEDLTGRNALNYHALSELLLASDCAGE